jgi:hypothetical protein
LLGIVKIFNKVHLESYYLSGTHLPIHWAFKLYLKYNNV